LIMVNSANSYLNRRKSIRNSWFNYIYTYHHQDPLETQQNLSFGDRVEAKFVLGKKEGVDVSKEVEANGDIVFVDVEDSYANLARKTLEFMKIAVATYEFDYFMHADDDSFVRLDLLLPVLDQQPREKLYWGYIWDNQINRITKPIRNPTAKSYMPYEQIHIRPLHSEVGSC